MPAESGELRCKTPANHARGRFNIAMGGHLYLRSGADAAMIFRAHPYLQKRYELQIRLIDIKSVADITARKKTVESSDGATESFRVDATSTFFRQLEEMRLKSPGRVTGVGRRDDDGPHYWATGNYDPERYYRETRGWSREYREYVKDAYGDLDTYNANKPD